MEISPRASATAAIALVTLASAAVAAAACSATPNAPPSGTAQVSPSVSAASAAPGPVSNHGPSSVPSASGGGPGGNGGGSAGRCHTSMLSARVVLGQPGAGQRYADLVLTNTSGTTCRVYGYPGMQLVNGSGGHIATAVERQPGAERLVALAPGQHASSLLHWTVVPGTGEGSPCEPDPAGLIVTPPDETAPLHTSWPGGAVCQHGQISVTAFQPGTNASTA